MAAGARNIRNWRRWVRGAGWAVAGAGAVCWVASMWLVTWRCTPRRTMWLRDGVVSVHNLGAYTTMGWSVGGLWFQMGRPFTLRWWPEEGVVRYWDDGSGNANWSVSLPLWMPTLAGAAVVMAVRRARRPATQCAGCGYDCTGLSGDCPECGKGRKG
ncbi:MAG: hypothetical protein KF745_14920 [Phycisphaeraceae bacterium]|nr:hypothetical protein [Phycisphaeraceae bacterium]